MLTTGIGPRPFAWTIHVQPSWSSPGSGPARPTCQWVIHRRVLRQGLRPEGLRAAVHERRGEYLPSPAELVRRRRVAVLGAGVMGTSTALFLARRGCDVT